MHLDGDHVRAQSTFLDPAEQATKHCLIREWLVPDDKPTRAKCSGRTLTQKPENVQQPWHALTR